MNTKKRHRTRTNPDLDRSFYAATYTPDGRFVEAVQSTRHQALAYAGRRAQSGEVIKLYTLPVNAHCLKFVEAFVKGEE